MEKEYILIRSFWVPENSIYCEIGTIVPQNKSRYALGHDRSYLGLILGFIKGIIDMASG